MAQDLKELGFTDEQVERWNQVTDWVKEKSQSSYSYKMYFKEFLAKTNKVFKVGQQDQLGKKKTNNINIKQSLYPGLFRQQQAANYIHPINPNTFTGRFLHYWNRPCFL